MVPCFPLLGLTPSRLFMGLSSTLIYTSELILCCTICVPSVTRHNIHMYPYFLFAAIHHLKSSLTFSVRPCSSVGRVTVDLIRRSWVTLSKMATENVNKSKLKTNTCTRKSTLTLVTLPNFSISGEIPAEKMYNIPPVIQTSVNFAIFNLHFPR